MTAIAVTVALVKPPAAASNFMVIDAVWVFVSSFGVASFAGLAALLRTKQTINWSSLLSAFLNSGLLGLGIALLWYTKFQENIYFLVGICLISGLGGMTTVDFILAAILKGGFSVKIGKDGEVGFTEGGKREPDK